MPRITNSSSCQKLDPRTLGRPIHLLQHFTEQLREDFAEMLRHELNRRYRSNFEVSSISMVPMGHSTSASRWQIFGAACGQVGVFMERHLVLHILAYRYGMVEDSSIFSDPARLPAETATEERLAKKLGLQFAGMVGKCVDHMKGISEQQAFTPVAGTSMAFRGAWVVNVQIQEETKGFQALLQVALDDAWMARLLHHLAPQRESSMDKHMQALPLASRLQLKIVAQLLEQDVLLGDLLDLKVGSVIPVDLGAADVLIDGSRLFTAAVAEHNGKLCLTSFLDSE